MLNKPQGTARIETGILVALLILYMIVGGLFALRTPPWQAPDEPAHYNYIAQVAGGGCCPVIEAGDWDQDYLEALKAARFAPDVSTELDSVQYEDHQPPLYYLLLSPVYSLTNGSLTALRLASAAFGILIIISAYATGKLMFPAAPQIGLGAAAFVAFLPQHVAILASVNNDALGWALAALILWAAVAYVKGRNVPAWLLGVMVGIGLITKATVYLMAGVVFVAVLLRWWQAHTENSPRTISGLVRPMLMYLIPALGLGFIWWMRNFSVYGFPDFLGLAAHDAVVIGQPRTADLIAQVGFAEYLRLAADVTFSSFWGRFGWMALPLVGNAAVNWIYPAFALLLIAAGGGLLTGFRRHPADEAITTAYPQQRAAWILMGLTLLLSVLAYVYYNTEFQQFQGRYMYPLLIPLGILLALGLDTWRRLLLPRFTAAQWAVVGLFMLMVPLDLWLLWTVIVPNLTA